MNKAKIKTILYDIFIKYQGLFVLLVIIDQVTKLIVMSNMEVNESIKIFSWLYIKFVYNTGVAFSFLKDAPQWISALFSILATIAIEAYIIIKKPQDKIMTILLLCLSAGALGNGIDRWLAVFNLRGGVVDFIWPTFFANFNVADIYVTCSCFAMIIYFLLAKDENKNKKIVKAKLPSEQKQELQFKEESKELNFKEENNESN